MVAAFNAATSFSGSRETIYSTGATIYRDAAVTSVISGVVKAFPNIWKNIGNINIPEDQWMEIPLVDN